MVFRGRPSKACQRCRQRRLRCDLQRPSCASCTRAGVDCGGWNDTEALRINNQTELVKAKAHAKVIVPVVIPSRANQAPMKLTHLPQDLQKLSRDMFFSYYVSDFSRTWDFLYPYLDNPAAPEHLTLGIDAVSLAFLAHQVNSPTAQELGRRKYCEALRKINKAVQSPGAARAATTFEGALLLDLFEKITKSASEINTSRHAHVDGALALVKLRGVEDFTEGSELRALLGLSLNASICALTTGRPIPKLIRDIRNHSAKYIDSTYPKWRLTGLMLDITDLASEIRTGTLTPEEKVRRAVELDLQLEAVSREASPAWSYERKFLTRDDAKTIVPEGFFPLYDVYPNRLITQMWNVLRLNRILLCEEIVDSSVQSQAEDREMQIERAKLATVEMIREICASVPQMTNCDFAAKHKLPPHSKSKDHTHTMSHVLDVYVLIFSLYVVAWSRNCPPKAREWTIKELHHIADHFAIQEAAIILDILKKQEEEDRRDFRVGSSSESSHAQMIHESSAYFPPTPGMTPSSDALTPSSFSSDMLTPSRSRMPRIRMPQLDGCLDWGVYEFTPLGPHDPRLCYRAAGFASGPWSSIEEPVWQNSAWVGGWS